MGVSRSPQELAHKLSKMRQGLSEMDEVTVREAAQLTKTLILQTASSRGVLPTSRIAGGKWGVRYDIKNQARPIALVAVKGPFHLVENDTRAHPIYRKFTRAKGRGARRINRQRQLEQAFAASGAYRYGALKLPDGNFRRIVQHPGTKGKYIFRDAKVKAERAIPREYERRVHKIITQALNHS